MKHFKEQEETEEKFIRRFTMILLFAMVALLSIIAFGCSGTHWHETRKTGIEKYSTYRMGWPASQACAVYNNSKPVKNNYIRRHTFSRKHVRQ